MCITLSFVLKSVLRNKISVEYLTTRIIFLIRLLKQDNKKVLNKDAVGIFCHFLINFAVITNILETKMSTYRYNKDPKLICNTVLNSEI